MDYHEPVMADEVIELLRVAPGARCVDGTLGGGGHTQRLLDASAPDGVVLSIDRDPAALEHNNARARESGGRLTLCAGNFGDIATLAATAGPADALLVDLGISSHQIDAPERGFSFARPGPLDMRMGADAGQTAGELIRDVDERELARIIRAYGEEPKARRIARAIKAAADDVETTTDLARVIADAIPPSPRTRRKIHPATKTFQALRIAVNDELGALERFLDSFVDVLAPGGRAAVIAFHSLEDRPVKRAFATLANPCICPPQLPVCGCGRVPSVSRVTTKPRRPSEAEVARNPRARSARLRVIERLP